MQTPQDQQLIQQASTIMKTQGWEVIETAVDADNITLRIRRARPPVPGGKRDRDQLANY